MYEQLKELYATDQEFLDKYHELSPADLESCVKRTVDDLTFGKIETVWMYDNEILIGYYGLDRIYNTLAGFFIKPEHRNRVNINNMLVGVYSNLGHKTIYTGVCPSNDKAISFLSKIGSIAGKTDTHVLFKLNRRD